MDDEELPSWCIIEVMVQDLHLEMTMDLQAISQHLKEMTAEFQTEKVMTEVMTMEYLLEIDDS